MLAKVKPYRPSDKEPFMNERQRDYFRAKLLAWREDILKEAKETLLHLQEENQNHPDLADRASSETDRSIELRARDRQRKLISKIDEAIGRIDEGTYGYCEETGEPISLRRLDARPIATLVGGSAGAPRTPRKDLSRRLRAGGERPQARGFKISEMAGPCPGRFFWWARLRSAHVKGPRYASILALSMSFLTRHQ